jgi:hypothetical protein
MVAVDTAISFVIVLNRFQTVFGTGNLSTSANANAIVSDCCAEMW